MKTRPKKTAAAKAAPKRTKKTKRTSKKNPKKTPVATPEKSYSKIEEIWADAPHDETRDYWIYDKLGIPLADRTSPEDLDQAFQTFLYKLVHLIQAGRLSEASIITRSGVQFLLGLLENMEASIPQFGEKGVVEGLLKYFANERSKRRAVPDRKSAAQKKYYRRSCEKALLEVIILHRAGWRRHWNSPRVLPVHPFGSPEGANDWSRWSMNFFKAIHEAGLINSNPDTKAANGLDPRGRVNVHRSVFTELHSLSQARLELKLDCRLARLNAEAEQLGGEIKTFLQAATLEHRDYAPKSRLNELMNHLGLPLLEEL